LLKILSFIAIFVFLGGGATLATRIWDPMWNPFRIEPKEVIANTQNKMIGLKTFHYDLYLEANSGKEKVTITGKSDVDMVDPNNSKTNSELVINFRTEGTEFSLSAEAKTRGEVSYFKINTIPAPLSMLTEMVGFNLEQVKGQWIKVDQDSMDKITETLYPKEIISEMKEKSEKNKINTERIKKLVEGKEIFIVKEEMEDEKIGKTDVYHYRIGLNEKEFEIIMTEAFKIVAENEENMALILEEDLYGVISEYVRMASDLTADVWIGKKDYLLYNIKFEKEIYSQEPYKSKIALDLKFSDFNKEILDETPQDFKKIEEIIVPILKNIFDSSRSRARDAKRQSDLRQFISAQEMYYGDSRKYVFTAAKKGLPAIANYLSVLNDPQCPGGVCESGAVNYSWQKNNYSLRCNNTKLNQTVGQWFCAYGRMENKGSCTKVAYFAASHQGSKMVCDAEPTITGSCTCF
jgi:type II secretory pathway pseudopilin PulG